MTECVHGDHDAVLTRPSKVDSPGVWLSLEIIKTRSSLVDAGFNVRLGRASPYGHRYLRGRRALDGIGTHTSSIDQNRLVQIDIGWRPSTETDEGPRSGGSGDACSGYAEDQVHGRVEVEQEHHGRCCIGPESHEEEDDAVLEEEFP